MAETTPKKCRSVFKPPSQQEVEAASAGGIVDHVDDDGNSRKSFRHHYHHHHYGQANKSLRSEILSSAFVAIALVMMFRNIQFGWFVETSKQSGSYVLLTARMTASQDSSIYVEATDQSISSIASVQEPQSRRRSASTGPQEAVAAPAEGETIRKHDSHGGSAANKVDHNFTTIRQQGPSIARSHGEQKREDRLDGVLPPPPPPQPRPAATHVQDSEAQTGTQPKPLEHGADSSAKRQAKAQEALGSETTDLHDEQREPKKYTAAQSETQTSAALGAAPTGTSLGGGGPYGITQKPVKPDDTPAQTTSACLLLMDDNNRLTEWIAYHYFAWDLRTLVVAVDPNSKTSPSEILDRWRREGGMTIVEWSDADFTTKDLSRTQVEGGQYDFSNTHNLPDWKNHNRRQTDFYRSCTNLLQVKKQGWTTYHDVDEYLVINKDSLKSAAELDKKLRLEPGGAFKFAMAVPHLKKNTSSSDSSEISFWADHYSGPCITFPRKYFSAVEAKPEQVARDVPTPFDGLRFDTLRYLYQARPILKNADSLGKSFLDVSQVGKAHTLGNFKVHKLVRRCPTPRISFETSPIRIHHYLGSWEAFSQRDDPRGASHRRTKFDVRAHDKSNGWNDEIRPWIAGFVKLVGQKKAEFLLESAGMIPNQPDAIVSKGPATETKPRDGTDKQSHSVGSAEQPELNRTHTASKLGIPVAAVAPAYNATTPDYSSFSACLLIMDDNHRLSEWLAYHYYALQLRYLVVAVDPSSRTSPSSVLEPWKKLMTIVEWHNDTFTARNLTRVDGDSHQKMHTKHLGRQGDFHRMCSFHLRKHKRTWTSYMDVDEYIAINDRAVKDAPERMKQPGGVLHLLHELSDTGSAKPSSSLWSSKKVADQKDYFRQDLCIPIARSYFSAVESTEEEVGKDSPPGLGDGKRFDTMRFRYPARSFRKKGDHLPKSVMDVSRVKAKDLEGRIAQYRVLKQRCPERVISYRDMPLHIHHYLGSWKTHSARGEDARGLDYRRDVWQARGQSRDGPATDEIRPWLQGFARLVGKDQAQRLLRHVGEPERAIGETASVR